MERPAVGDHAKIIKVLLPGRLPFASSRSLLVYRAEALATEGASLDAAKGAIVFESRYDLDALADTSVEANESLLIDAAGRIAYRSGHTIGHRVAYVAPDGEGGSAEERGALYRPGDTLLAPITNAWIENGLSFAHRVGTDVRGRYESHFSVPPCPGFSHEYEIPVFAAIPYRSFNPQREGSMNSYLLSGTSYYRCVGARFPQAATSIVEQQSQIRAREIIAGIVSLPSPVNFAVDVTLISGRFALHNAENDPVPLGERTRYRAPPIRNGEDEFEDHRAAEVNLDAAHISDIGSFGTEDIGQGLQWLAPAKYVRVATPERNRDQPPCTLPPLPPPPNDTFVLGSTTPTSSPCLAIRVSPTPSPSTPRDTATGSTPPPVRWQCSSARRSRTIAPANGSSTSTSRVARRAARRCRAAPPGPTATPASACRSRS